ncbi:LLM class flavin-dependent oxidoreductase [Rhodococcoides kyotonense]|uniref:Luciferase-like monooxygenase n=1 Tax=Rhodococcoides kyotonense TaxID=398843 RepID=A0A239GAB4_9NOCA|nr:LLM class flavin-dependent oxidoreductase [Rhodococcus kyotonensis]SNS66097.1 Luciferase-like monooxygenase [Rhodococcus kyotonensis]
MPPDIRLSLVLDPNAESPGHVVEQARIAERGLFDAVFAGASGRTGLEPSTLLSAVAASTTHIGVVGAVSPQYTAPYNQARYISTLDHLSKGRTGWNLVLPEQDTDPALHGRSQRSSSRERYSRADELVTVLKALWEAWDSDAVVADKSSGLYVRRESIHRTDHRGEHFAVAGPFNLPRSPQVHPPLYASVGSAESADFAAAHADVAVLSAWAPAVSSVSNLREVAVSEVDSLAAELVEQADRDGVDGFVLHASVDLTRAVVDTVVPQLQAAGRYRSAYSESTLAPRLKADAGVGAVL